jgi:hypothetical protein
VFLCPGILTRIKTGDNVWRRTGDSALCGGAARSPGISVKGVSQFAMYMVEARTLQLLRPDEGVDLTLTILWNGQGRLPLWNMRFPFDEYLLC